MSDKKLLEESTIRRFQTLANIKSLDVLEEGKKKTASKGKEEKPAGGRKTASAMKPEDSEKRAAGKELEESLEEETLEEEAVEEMFMGEAEGEEAGGEADMGADAGGEKGEDVRDEVQAIADAVNNLLEKIGQSDFSMDLEAGAEGGEAETGAEAGGEEAGGEAGGEGAVMEAKKKKEEKKKKHEKEEDEEEKEESMYEGVEILDDDVLAEELTKRVAARLVQEMRKSSGSAGSSKWYMKGSPKGKRPTPHPVGKGTPFTGGKSKKK